MRNDYGKAGVSEPMLEGSLTFEGEEMIEKRKKRERAKASPYSPKQQ